MPLDEWTGETVLIVDDEEAVRRTFCEWLEEAALNCRIVTARDAEEALTLANEQSIDLAILDWNLGAGNDGLRLLEDLYLFNPDVVAIMVTGFAHQATPLDAMRMGVRDYLDKNHDLDRTTFLRAVRRQLDSIRPAKRERKLFQSLKDFRNAVEKILPLVQSATAMNDPVPLPGAIASLFGFVQRITGATDGVLLVRSYNAKQSPPEICRVYDSSGSPLDVEMVPFARSVAGTVVSLGEAQVINQIGPEPVGTIDWQPFERGRRSLLAVPLPVAPGIQVVMELFDKHGPGSQALPFTEDDRRLVGAASAVGAAMLRQALAERHGQRLLFDTLAAALRASESVAAGLASGRAEERERVSASSSSSLPAAGLTPQAAGSRQERWEETLPAVVLERLREGLAAAPAGAVDADDAVRLAEVVRVLALRHGPAAVQHCIRCVEDLRNLLDTLCKTY